jgi:hypothetical protein
MAAEYHELEKEVVGLGRASKANSLLQSAPPTVQTLHGSPANDSDNAVVPVPSHLSSRTAAGSSKTQADIQPFPLSQGTKNMLKMSGPSVPLVSQSAMTALVLSGCNVFTDAFSGKRPRSMVLNPFSCNTVFDGIAAVSAMDG